MGSLSISDLFTPAPSGVGATPTTTPASGSWLARSLSIAQTLGLNVTAWQPGGVARTVLSIASVLFAQSDVLTSIMAQGGFLDFAATGTVTSVGVNGVSVTTPVTPDPSIPSQNPTGALGWLDLVASSVYGVQRIAATRATNLLAFVNTSSSSYGPYVAGTYHAANPTTNASYTNVASLTIPPSAISGTGGKIVGVVNSPATLTTQSAHGLVTGQVVYVTGASGVTGLNTTFFSIVVTGTTTFILQNASLSGSYTSGGTVYLCTTSSFQADAAGTASNSAPNAITQSVTSNIGVSLSNVNAFAATNWESNIALAARCRLKLQSLSPNGPAGAYQFFALSASQFLPSSVALSSAIVQALVQTSPLTGVVTTTIANASPISSTLNQPVVEGSTNVAISGATSASPIVVQTAVAHGLNTGDFVTVSGVLGNYAANGTWSIVKQDATHFQLVNSTGSGTYTSGGVVEGGDLGQVDALLQSMCVPDGATVAVTQSALAFPVSVVATVLVPNAKVGEYTTNVAAALSSYFSSLPIGGAIPPGGTSGVLQYDDVIGVLFAAGAVNGNASYVKQMTGVTLAGGGVGPVATNLTFTNPIWFAIPVPTIVVQGA